MLLDKLMFFGGLSVLAAGCSGTTLIESPGAGGGGSTSTTITTATTSTTSSSTSTTTSTIDPGAAELSGHWMRSTFGDCANFEEWYSFTPPGGFVHTAVDLDFCGPHSLEASPGTFTVAASNATIEWTHSAGMEAYGFTFAVIDPHPVPPDLGPDYAGGPRALNVEAYRRAGEELVWHRESQRRSESPQGVYSSTLRVDVALDAPIEPSTGITACNMTVTLHAAVDPPYAMGKPAEGTETFTFACTYGITMTSYFMRLIPDGFDPYSSDWYEVLKTKGVYDKYDGGVVSLFESGFRPVLFFDPADTSALFHDGYSSWFYEVKSPPPDAVD